MNTKEMIEWLNHSLTLNWSDKVAEARDLLQQEINA